eukprot:5407092-Pyramimonas_sp.AAC.1
MPVRLTVFAGLGSSDGRSLQCSRQIQDAQNGTTPWSQSAGFFRPCICTGRYAECTFHETGSVSYTHLTLPTILLV